jgi:hypothetical protein
MRMTAPAALLESTVNVAILSQAGAGGAAGAIARGVTKMMFTSKLKLAAAACIALTMGGLVTGQVLRHVLAPAAMVAGAAAVDLPNVGESGTITVDQKIKAQFIGVARCDTKEWHDIQGKAIAKPTTAPAAEEVKFVRGKSTHMALIKVWCPDEFFIVPNVEWAIEMQTWKIDLKPGERTFLIAFAMSPGLADPNSTAFSIHISRSPWKAVLSSKQWETNQFWGGDRSGVVGAFSPLVERNGKSAVFVTLDSSGMKGPTRVICKDLDGHEYEGDSTGGIGIGNIHTGEYDFDLAIPLIGSIELQSRPYTNFIRAKNISLDPARPLKPEITAEEGK